MPHRDNSNWSLFELMEVRMKTHPEVPCSREVLSVFMEGHRHDPVRGVEGLLHSISVVDVYVDVQHPLVVPGSEAQRQSSDQYKLSALDVFKRNNLSIIYLLLR